MREKYVEERYSRYFVFGSHKDGRVDVASAERDTVATVSREHADVLIQDRDRLVDALARMAVSYSAANSQAFVDFWYGSELR